MYTRICTCAYRTNLLLHALQTDDTYCCTAFTNMIRLLQLTQEANFPHGQLLSHKSASYVRSVDEMTANTLFEFTIVYFQQQVERCLQRHCHFARSEAFTLFLAAGKSILKGLYSVLLNAVSNKACVKLGLKGKMHLLP